MGRLVTNMEFLHGGKSRGSLYAAWGKWRDHRFFIHLSIAFDAVYLTLQSSRACRIITRMIMCARNTDTDGEKEEDREARAVHGRERVLSQGSRDTVDELSGWVKRMRYMYRDIASFCFLLRACPDFAFADCVRLDVSFLRDLC